MNLRRRILGPEVVQTSDMDCGPATLKCLLQGFGVTLSYPRIRDACQTEVDGTSIDTLEEVAVQLGLDAEQVVVPADHLLLPAADLLPALVVFCSPGGLTHFAVAWSEVGSVVQIMDPAVGREWLGTTQFLNSLYIHSMPVLAEAWSEWARSHELLLPLGKRIAKLGIREADNKAIVASALANSTWRGLAALDAATRLLGSIVCGNGLHRGNHLGHVLQGLVESAIGAGSEQCPIPSDYWHVKPCPADAEGNEQLLLRGAVLVRVRGKRTDNPRSDQEKQRGPLPPEELAALSEQTQGPVRELLRMFRKEGLLAPAAIVAAAAVAGAMVLLEALLFRGLFDLGRELVMPGQRVVALAMLIVFTAALLVLELPLTSGLLGFGRHLETRLRMALLEKIPLLGDRYFRTRLTSDMAERSHSLYRVRHLADLGGSLLRTVFEICFTAAGIAWLDPRSASLAIATAAVAIAVPLAFQPVLLERDLRFRSHGGALCRFYLDALLGLVAVRAHGAQRSIRREHEGLLVEWARSALFIQRALVTCTGIQFFLGFTLATWLLIAHLLQGSTMSSALLLAYWALNLPMLGQDLGTLAAAFPDYRNAILRAMEPLVAAPAEVGSEMCHPPCSRLVERPGIEIQFDHVSVQLTGRTILRDITAHINSGAHVAIIGPSGAGKSSLVGLLLGLLQPTGGELRVDRNRLDSQELERLRSDTAWVDPAVQLWNRSLYENLTYGNENGTSPVVGTAVEKAELVSLLERLPDGLQSALGESGGLVSGGEGQRVRLGRAFLRANVRLVILDEPFQGLDHQQRQQLLERARQFWHRATLLCVTHDVRETSNFDHVLVIEDGAVTEQGTPADLRRQAESRYNSIWAADEAVRELWSGNTWRRFYVANGELLEGPCPTPK
jgi:ATP-binding cassette subfamily B protein